MFCSRDSRFFCFVKSTNFKIGDTITDIAAYIAATLQTLHFRLFLVKHKYYQNEIWSNTSVSYKNISNMSLAQYWRLETSSRPLYDFNEMTI